MKVGLCCGLYRKLKEFCCRLQRANHRTMSTSEIHCRRNCVKPTTLFRQIISAHLGTTLDIRFAVMNWNDFTSLLASFVLIFVTFQLIFCWRVIWTSSSGPLQNMTMSDCFTSQISNLSESFKILCYVLNLRNVIRENLQNIIDLGHFSILGFFHLLSSYLISTVVWTLAKLFRVVMDTFTPARLEVSLETV